MFLCSLVEAPQYPCFPFYHNLYPLRILLKQHSLHMLYVWVSYNKDWRVVMENHFSDRYLYNLYYCLQNEVLLQFVYQILL